MTKLLIFDAFTLLIGEKNVANYALLQCKTFSLKIWLCKIFDKFHVCVRTHTQTRTKPAAPPMNKLFNLRLESDKAKKLHILHSALHTQVRKNTQAEVGV